MGTTIRARVTQGLLKPLDKVNLPEGEEVLVTIEGIPSAQDVEAFHRSAGGWKGKVDAEALIRNIYEGRLVSTRTEPRL